MLELRTDSRTVGDCRRFLTFVDADLEKRRKVEGYYVLRGGAVLPAYSTRLNSKEVEMAFRFKNTRTDFLDRLVDAVMRNRGACKLNFALRSDRIDFESLKGKLNLDNAAHDSQNFGGTVKDVPGPLRVSAYPKIQLLTFVSEFGRDGVKPSVIVDKLLEGSDL